MEFDFQDIEKFANFWSRMAQNCFGGLEKKIRIWLLKRRGYRFFEKECTRGCTAHGKENG
jgi:hypothetical protein